VAAFPELSAGFGPLETVQFGRNLAEFSRKANKEVFVIPSIALAVPLSALRFPTSIFASALRVTLRIFLSTLSIPSASFLGSCATDEV
jgi:hypothetical protein